MDEKASWFAIAGSAAAVSPESVMIVLREYVNKSFKKQVRIKMEEVKKLISGELASENLTLNITDTSGSLEGALGGILPGLRESKFGLLYPLRPVGPLPDPGPVKMNLTAVAILNPAIILPVLEKLNPPEPDPSDIQEIEDLIDNISKIEDEIDKQSQLMQELSDIMKQMHEMQMAIIRNMKA